MCVCQIHEENFGYRHINTHSHRLHIKTQALIVTTIFSISKYLCFEYIACVKCGECWTNYPFDARPRAQQKQWIKHRRKSIKTQLNQTLKKHYFDINARLPLRLKLYWCRVSFVLVTSIFNCFLVLLNDSSCLRGKNCISIESSSKNLYNFFLCKIAFFCSLYVGHSKYFFYVFWHFFPGPKETKMSKYFARTPSLRNRTRSNDQTQYACWIHTRIVLIRTNTMHRHALMYTRVHVNNFHTGIACTTYTHAFRPKLLIIR